ncbi:hypothetical protein SAMN05421766_103267 [Zobellia uliginosa]|uniref:Uncharacterized protein n=1 Tax=Zobellia uliginosa TaxID=143224 RepID=A0ABY1KUL6_9FLAO|nr:hypothetical protein [Zobellia uliginosa]SIS67109.1 hypothetical protein SAMN05421766_103267 [Zobellia uliginosa]
MPQEAQFSPLFGIDISDYDDDGYNDVIGVGNYYPTEVISGWYDAGKGVILKSDRKGGFISVPYSESGFKVEKDARALVSVVLNDSTKLWAATVNSGKLKSYIQKKHTPILEFGPSEVRAKIHYDNGDVATKEYYFGSGYLSQTSNAIQVHKSMQKVVFYDKEGNRREVVFNPKE